MGSVAAQRAGLPRLSTTPSAAAPGATSPSVAAAGGVLLVAAMVAAGFRARARLGRLG